jgi:large subunit ribosomal protein L47
MKPDEVLRAHVKNWKMLNLKQRRIAVNLINMRRAKESRIEFFKELDLISQKIAHDDLARA